MITNLRISTDELQSQLQQHSDKLIILCVLETNDPEAEQFLADFAELKAKLDYLSIAFLILDAYEASHLSRNFQIQSKSGFLFYLDGEVQLSLQGYQGVNKFCSRIREAFVGC